MDAVSYRHYWAEELKRCIQLETSRNESCGKLIRTSEQLREQVLLLSNLLTGFSAMPSFCGNWRGERAEEIFRQCSEGPLFEHCTRLAEDARKLLADVLERLQSLKAEAEDAKQNRIRAEYYCRFWEQCLAVNSR